MVLRICIFGFLLSEMILAAFLIFLSVFVDSTA